jgi:hypothetical protein
MYPAVLVEPIEDAKQTTQVLEVDWPRKDGSSAGTLVVVACFGGSTVC